MFPQLQYQMYCVVIHEIQIDQYPVTIHIIGKVIKASN